MKTVYIRRNDLFKNLNMLLCNNITSADPGFYDNNIHLISDDCESCAGSGEDKDGKRCDDCAGEGRHDLEPYQYFLTSVSEYTKEWLESYGVTIGYSDLLDLEVIAIYDYGTSWDAFSYSKEVEDDYTLGYNETLTRNTVY
jgi:hypothetical protein